MSDDVGLLQKEWCLPEQLPLPEEALEGTRGISFRPNRETQEWTEWWVAKECVKLLPSGLGISPATSARWTRTGDTKHAPDFRVEFSSGDWVELEVTEVTHQRDRQAIALRRRVPGIHTVGEPFVDEKGQVRDGGRFSGGVVGNAYEEAVAKDLLRACQNKAKKPYAKRSVLAGYANSNA